jgi:hypothetical protein
MSGEMQIKSSRVDRLRTGAGRDFELAEVDHWYASFEGSWDAWRRGVGIWRGSGDPRRER